MSSSQIRDGFQNVVPYLVIQQAERLVEFLCVAFGAQRTYSGKNGTHFEVRIGDSVVMIGDIGNGPSRPGQLFMYVEDAEALYKRAIEAGASPVLEPCERPWGDNDELLRAAGVSDPAGNNWFLAGPT